MIQIRDDVQQKLSHALTMVKLAKTTGSKEMLSQHLEQVERLIEMVLASIKVENEQG